MQFFTRGKGRNRTIIPLTPPKSPILLVRPSRVTKESDTLLSAKGVSEYASKLKSKVDQYYGSTPLNVKIIEHQTNDSYMNSTGFAYEEKFTNPTPYSAILLDDDSIHVVPNITRLLQKGKIENIRDLMALDALVHEIGHLHGTYQPKQPTKFATFGEFVDEGLNHLLTTRFILQLPMTEKLRTEAKRKLRSMAGWPYRFAADFMGFVALIVSKGEPKEALTWLMELKTANPAKQKAMVRAALKITNKYFPDDWSEDADMGGTFTSGEELRTALKEETGKSFPFSWWVEM